MFAEGSLGAISAATARMMSRKADLGIVKLTEVTQKSIMPAALSGEEEEGGSRGGGKSGGSRKKAA